MKIKLRKLFLQQIMVFLLNYLIRLTLCSISVCMLGGGMYITFTTKTHNTTALGNNFEYIAVLFIYY